MNDVAEQVDNTFRTVAESVPVPPFDEVAFRAGVRRARRRRTAKGTAMAVAAAGIAATAVVAVPPLLHDGPGTSHVAGTPDGAGEGEQPVVHPEALPQPLYFVVGNDLFAATPDRMLHDLGVEVDGIVGATAEGVLVTDHDSRLTWIGASASGEGDGAFTFRRGAGATVVPDPGPVQSAALSGDGRYLAWITLDDDLVVYDLKAERRISSLEVGRNAYVTSVSDRGALVSVNGDVWLFGDGTNVHVPTKGDGYGWLSDVAGDYASVADRDDVTRIYDVTRLTEDGTTAKLVDSVPGTGRLAPYARGVVSVHGSTAQLWPTDAEPRTLPVAGAPQSAGWLDEDYALVTSAEAGGTTIYLCPVAEPACTAVVHSGGDVRLAE